MSLAIAGTGFIGAVHAHAVRAAGGTRRRRARLDARARAEAARAARRRARLRRRGGAARRPGGRRRPRLHAQPPARGARAAGARGRQARRLREAAGHRRRRRAPAGARPPRPATASPPSRSSTATTRPSARRAPASPAARSGAVHLVHGTYLQDWLLEPDDDNWRVDAELGGASRAFADIGSHWCDLAEFVTGHRITRLSARTLDRRARARARRRPRAAFARGDGDGDAARGRRPRTPSSLQFETDGGALGSAVISQVSAGRKNRLWLEVDCAERGARLRPGGRRDAVGRPPRARPCSSAATRPRCRPPPRAWPTLPGRPPAGLPGLLQPVRRRRLRRDRATGAAPDGLPAFADGLRAAQHHRRRPRLGARGALGRRRAGGGGAREARLPDRLHARALARGDRGAGPARNGFETLELAAWPGEGDRPFVARHLAAEAFDGAEADRVRSGARRATASTLSALAYYDNNLHPDPPTREAIHAHLRACIDAAADARRRARSARSSAATPAQVGRREPARGRARLPAARRLRRRARRAS